MLKSMRLATSLLALFVFIAGCGSDKKDSDPHVDTDAGSDVVDENADEFDAATDVEQDVLTDAGAPLGELLLQGGGEDRVVPHLATREDGTTFLGWS
jgi:hypothetical protein